MQRKTHAGAARAFLAPLVVLGLGLSASAQGSAPAPAGQTAQAGAAPAGQAQAPAAVAAKSAPQNQGKEVERKCGPRLKPGLARLETGVDLSKIPASASDDVVAQPAETLPTIVGTTATATAGQAAAPGATIVPMHTQGAGHTQGDGQDHSGHDHAQGEDHSGHDHAQDGSEQDQVLQNLPPGHLTIVGEEVHNFGQLIQGAHATHVFRLVSDGENDLVISRIKASCGCTVASASLVQPDGSRVPYVSGTGIPPGAQVEIEAAFKSDGKQGHTKTQVSLYCNDPRSVVSLMLEAEVLPVLVLEPRTLTMGKATSAQAVQGTMRLTSPTLPAFKVEVDQQLLQPLVQVELKPIEPDAEGRAKAWDVNVTLGPELPEGMRNYPIRLTTDQAIPSPRSEFEEAATNYFVIGYAQVEVQGLVSANPAYVPFGMVRPGQQVERVVRIECQDDFQLRADVVVQMTNMIQSEVFDYAKAFTTRIDPVEGKNALDLTVRLEGLPDSASGSFGGMLKLDIGHPHKQELMVRFSGVCRPGVPDPGGKDQ